MFDEASVRALVMSLAAGLSTLLGALAVVLAKDKNPRLLAIALGFAAGVMLSVSFTDLFPNAQAQLSEAVGTKGGVVLSVVLLAGGVLLAGAIDHFVPHEPYDPAQGGTAHANLFRVGFVSMLAIGLHNFPEGIATFMAGYENAALGTSIALAIALHNIPEGIAVAMPIYFATGKKSLAFKYTFLSGIAEPIGAVLAFLVLRPFMNAAVLGGIFAVVAGIMIYICIEELIPSSRQYGFDRSALLATLAGVCIMPLTHVL